MKSSGVAFVVAASLAKVSMADVVLSKKIIELATLSAELSSLAYEENPPGDAYDFFGFYDEEPDQALVVKQNGYCFGAFRGTTLTWIDWQQNFDLGFEKICSDEETPDEEPICCSTREGFYKAYYTSYQQEMEDSLRKCASECKDADECVVLTGHSQGGAIAAVAGVIMADLNPYVITFGQPSTIDAPCPLVTSERWYRFINTKASSSVGITYDPVPFVPGMGAEAFGHMIILGEDLTGVAYIGLDVQDSFGPLNVAGFEAHSMVAAEGVDVPGYADRLALLVNNTEQWPIRANGYAAGTLCSQGSECMSGVCEAETHFTFNRCVGQECTTDDECESGRCDSGVCTPKLSSCMPCDEDSDCAGGRCLLFKCSRSEDELMDDECICKWDSDCASGRCESIAPPTCEAQLGIGARCNEHTDCLSGYCSWFFRCEDISRAAALEAENPDNLSVDNDSGGLSMMWKIVIIVAALIVVVFGLRWYRRYREGYTQVNTELNV